MGKHPEKATRDLGIGSSSKQPNPKDSNSEMNPDVSKKFDEVKKVINTESDQMVKDLRDEVDALKKAGTTDLKACEEYMDRIWRLRDKTVAAFHAQFPIQGLHEIKPVKLDIKRYAIAKNKFDMPSLSKQISKLTEKGDDIKVLTWNRSFRPKDGQAFRKNDPNERKIQSAMLNHHIKVAKTISKLTCLNKLTIVDAQTKYSAVSLDDIASSIPYSPHITKLVLDIRHFALWAEALGERAADKHTYRGYSVVDNFKLLDNKFPNLDVIKVHIADKDCYCFKAHKKLMKLRNTRLLFLSYECKEKHVSANVRGYERCNKTGQLENIEDLAAILSGLDVIDY